jgi:sterol desaturase/sphingolipid hydroxylase (fatty acid hydroxylase superfamily)
MPPTLASTLIGLVVLGALFWPLERLWPARRGQPRWRADHPTDLAYWFFTPFVTRAVTRLSLAVAVVALAVALGVPLDAAAMREFAAAGRGGIVAQQPAWLQVLEVLLLGDLIGYASHRLFHGRRLWRFHAIHHSSTRLDWLSSVRLHPVNDVVGRLLQAVPLFLLGFPPTLLAGYVPFLTFYAILLHANVRWTFGPLRYVLASPAFHHWHHTTEAEGLDKNFAGLFPFIDLLFGTFYMPRDRTPSAYGLLHNDVPTGLFGQLAYPFRRRGAPPRPSDQPPATVAGAVG